MSALGPPASSPASLKRVVEKGAGETPAVQE
jgi:hypothetical protein